MAPAIKPEPLFRSVEPRLGQRIGDLGPALSIEFDGRENQEDHRFQTLLQRAFGRTTEAAIDRESHQAERQTQRQACAQQQPQQ